MCRSYQVNVSEAFLHKIKVSLPPLFLFSSMKVKARKMIGVWPGNEFLLYLGGIGRDQVSISFEKRKTLYISSCKNASVTY